jgi:hypothetical protein
MEPVHVEVLEAARRIADPQGLFRLRALVAALPHLNAGTVRTHVASRCCVDAPPNHQTRHRYFSLVERGLYRIQPQYLDTSARPSPSSFDRILRKLASGVDATLVVESLRKTPTERLETMRRAAASFDRMRR